MDAMELMKARHSVRKYIDRPIPPEVRAELDRCAAECNKEGGLNIQIFYDEPSCFGSRMARYGSFENVKNYIAMVGVKADDLAERCGYYGEKLVLRAQELGLNTCWVALTHGKSSVVPGPGEKEVILIALGYGQIQGSPHRSKSPDAVSNIGADSPEWFRRGVEAALLAPTAVNQQKFRFSLDGNRVTAKTSGIGFNLKTDLGIVKYHFELGAGKENFTWSSANG